MTGDTLSMYTFDVMPKVGDTLIFCDVGHYIDVSRNYFNGTEPPSGVVLFLDGSSQVTSTPSYQHYAGSIL